MKVSPPSVRLLVAALVAVFLMPITAGANAVRFDQTLKVAMTAYNAVPEQTSNHPDVTASGAYSNPQIVAARSQDLSADLPFGTVIEIDAAGSSPTCGYGAVGSKIGLRVIADSMNVKWRKRIDILLPLRDKKVGANPASVLGLCKNVTIHVVGHIDINNMPRTQAELASALDSSADLAVAK